MPRFVTLVARQRFAALAFLLALGCNSDPGHGGRSSAAWMTGLSRGDTRTKVQAAEALRQVLEIRPDYPEVVRALVTALQDTSDAVRIAAASALTADGVETRTAIDGLHAVMHDSAHADVRASVLLIISRLSPDRAIALLPYLCEVLKDPNARVRAAAVDAIGAMRSAAAEEVPSIAEMSNDSSSAVREAVLRALVSLQANSSLLLRVSRSALRDSSASVRIAAAETLRSMGPAAAPAVEDLAIALADTNVTVMRSAVIAIGAIGPAAKRALPALRSLETRLTDAPQPLIRETIEFVEGRAGPVRSPEPTLQERCRNSSSDPGC